MDHSKGTGAGSRVVLLAIDDDPDDVAILRHHLERLPGVEVELHAFSRVEEGLAAGRRGTFDAILLDYQLGACTGVDVFDELQLAGVDTPAILVTDQGDEEIAVGALHAGFADYIPKDALSPRSLRRAILNAIEKHDLRKAVVRYHEDLERTVADLRRRNEEIQSFYHSLSHELKTPLTAAREFVAIVLDGLQGPLTEGQRDSLETSKAACDHMVRCIHDLLDASRLDTGKLALDVARRPIEEAVERAVAQTLPAAAALGVDLQATVDADCEEAWYDLDRMVQVLTNLVGNGIKFTEAGGAVHVHAGPSEEHEGHLSVSVTDTGSGIAEEELERIFDRLYQTSEGDAAIHGGLGLGLNLCRELVRLHGGEISVASERGRGSVFTFTVPTFELTRTEDPMGEVR